MKTPQEHIDTYEWPKEIDRGQLRMAFRAVQLDAIESLKKEAVELEIQELIERNKFLEGDSIKQEELLEVLKQATDQLVQLKTAGEELAKALKQSNGGLWIEAPHLYQNTVIDGNKALTNWQTLMETMK